MKFVAIRSYSRRYTSPTGALNEYLQEGWEVVCVNPFIKNGETDYLEYILKEPDVK